jgi:5-methylcytosine-specific restriction endonuclease McrA
MDKTTYKTKVSKYKKDKKIQIFCVECGEDNPTVIEMHHVDGRNNSNWEIPLCKNCHTKVTAEQNKESPKVRSKDATLLNKRACRIISNGALLRDIGDGLIEIGREMVENE